MGRIGWIVGPELGGSVFGGEQAFETLAQGWVGRARSIEVRGAGGGIDDLARGQEEGFLAVG
jgi:hypothetical protein